MNSILNLDPHREHNRGRNHEHQRQSEQDFRLKFDIPPFNGQMHIEDFFDSMKSVEMFFECMELHEEKQFKLVTYKLCGGAAAWWEQLQAHRHHEGKQLI